MAIDHSRMASVASRLIASNGRSVTLVKFSRTAADTAKPWEGPAATASTETAVTAVFVDPSTFGYTASDAADSLIRSGDKIALVAATSGIEKYDEIHDGTDVWKIVRVKTLEPGTVRIVHELQLRGMA